jgi:O-antigen/teichoic acid export membrane protein
MIKKRIAGNLVANIFASVVNIVWQLGAVPLFLGFWSKEQYGEWLLLFTIPTYMSLADAGLSTTAANEVAMLVAAGNMEEARRSLHTACGFLAMVSFGLIFFVGLGAFLLPWKDWLLLRGLGASEISWTIFYLTIYTVAGFTFALYGSIYRAAYRAPRVLMLTSYSRLAELLAIGLSLIYSRSFVTLAASLTLVRLVTFGVLYVDGRRLSPGLQLGVAHFSRNHLSRTWRPSLMFMAFALGNAFYFQGLTLLTGRMLGPVAVVVFNTTRTLTRAIVQFVAIIKHAIWLEFSYLFGARDLGRSRRLNNLAFEVTWVATFLLAGLLYILGPRIMQLWTHRAVSLDHALLLLFLFGAVLNSLWSVCSGFLLGANQHSKLGVLYVSTTAVSLLVAFPLSDWLGLSGIAWSMILCESILLPYTFIQTCSLLEQPLSEFLLDSLRLKQVCLSVSELLARRRFPSAHKLG